MKTVLAVTPGDPAGIGPEIVWKTLIDSKFRRELRRHNAELLCVGAREPFDALGAKIVTGPSPADSRAVWLLPAPTIAPNHKGKRLLLPGYQAGWSIEKAVRLVQKSVAAAIVTGPIHKGRLNEGGFRYDGHTEMLAALCRSSSGRSPSVTMMLANEQLRVSLVTVHRSLKSVPSAITREAVRRAVLHTAESLQNWFGIGRPRIAVTALNPHAGEGGLFGDEEIKVIAPELRSLQKKLGSRYTLLGPLPADTLFAKHLAAKPADRFDAVVAMYHDQGLTAVKLVDFAHTVNLTLGLPIIRTSVDHGTGFDIAGKGIADPSSLQSAILLALEILRKGRHK